jgi:hypothetical protein
MQGQAASMTTGSMPERLFFAPRQCLMGARLQGVRAFSSEVDTGSREENASKQKPSSLSD